MSTTGYQTMEDDETVSPPFMTMTNATTITTTTTTTETTTIGTNNDIKNGTNRNTNETCHEKTERDDPSPTTTTTTTTANTIVNNATTVITTNAHVTTRTATSHSNNNGNRITGNNSTKKMKQQQQLENGGKCNSQFLSSLGEFLTQRGKSLKIPTLGHKELDLEQLYNEVTMRGGVQAVIDNKWWHNIVRALKLPSTCTNAAYALRVHYLKLLKEYEEVHFKKPLSSGMVRNFSSKRGHKRKRKGMKNDSETESDTEESDEENSSNGESNDPNMSNIKRQEVITDSVLVDTLTDSSIAQHSQRKPKSIQTKVEHPLQTDTGIRKQRKTSNAANHNRKTTSGRKNASEHSSSSSEHEMAATQMFKLFQTSSKKRREQFSYQYHVNGVVTVTVDETFGDEFDLDETFLIDEDEEDEDSKIDENEEIVIVSDELLQREQKNDMNSSSIDVSRLLKCGHCTILTAVQPLPPIGGHTSSHTAIPTVINPSILETNNLKDGNNSSEFEWKKYLTSLSLSELKRLRRYFNINTVTSSSEKEDLVNAMLEHFESQEDRVLLELQQQLEMCS